MKTLQSTIARPFKALLATLGIGVLGAFLFGLPGVCGMTGGILADSGSADTIGFVTFAGTLLAVPCCILWGIVAAGFHIAGRRKGESDPVEVE